LAILLSHVGLPSDRAGLVIEVQGDARLLRDKLAQVARLENLSAEIVLTNVGNMQREKWDWVLPPWLLMNSFASMRLDLETARNIARQIAYK
jgi:ATP-dependent Lhr-like helicase